MDAIRIMRGFNPHALEADEDGRKVFIEDVRDSDGRWFRLEYRCRPDGSDATAWVLFNPWGGNPFPYEQSHLGSDGLICVGPSLHRQRSPYNLDFTVRRARFWCEAYSFYREHGFEQTCRVIPEWRG